VGSPKTLGKSLFSKKDGLFGFKNIAMYTLSTPIGEIIAERICTMCNDPKDIEDFPM